MNEQTCIFEDIFKHFFRSDQLPFDNYRFFAMLKNVVQQVDEGLWWSVSGHQVAVLSQSSLRLLQEVDEVAATEVAGTPNHEDAAVI